MAANSFSFPHPVLGNGDDITIGAPACELSCMVAPDIVTLSVDNAKTANPTIETLLSSQSAAWVFRLHCARTYFRNAWLLANGLGQIVIPTSSLDGRVDVETFVAARTPVSGYVPAGLHEDYAGKAFSIPVGEVVAVGPTFRFVVDPDFDPLKAPISSFLRLVPGNFEEGPFSVVWDSQDLLLVHLSKKDWEQYQQLKQDRFAPILHSSLVLPVLVEAIAKRIDDADLQETKWVQRLQEILKSRNISAADPSGAAQSLLDQPLSRAFATTLKELNALE